jgi:hypothetical protein
MGFLSSLLGGGIVGSLERVALEAINTDQETAEAKSLYVKTLDPNGKMRRDLSRFACRAYGFYLVTAVILIFMHSFGVGEADNSKTAMEAMTALFLPITASWATIVSASFGVNGVNSFKGSR